MRWDEKYTRCAEVNGRVREVHYAMLEEGVRDREKTERKNIEPSYPPVLYTQFTEMCRIDNTEFRWHRFAEMSIVLATFFGKFCEFQLN